MINTVNAGRKLLIFLCFLFSVYTADAQFYPSGYFASPMDTPLYLSAPFGSLRDNHFHSGMDIRTYEKEGLPVYAVADGYISRVKIQGVGYGKAIYIDHPNGYTSVYGHLKGYEGEIAAYIKKYQYENQSFETDHFPGKNRLKVTKGQVIGWSGNTGTSSGPHLHFEIRRTRSEDIINPQLFGIAAKDSFPPVIKKLLAYNLDNQRPELVMQKDLARMKNIRTDSGLVFTDTLMLPPGGAGFGVEAIDLLMHPTKEYSIYSLSCDIDQKKYFSFRLDRFAFSETRCINVHIDYAAYKNEGIRYQKLFIDDGNRIPLYPFSRNKGKFILQDTVLHTLKLTAGDISGRSTTCYFTFRSDPYRQVRPVTETCNQQWLFPQKNNTWKNEKISVQFPEGSLYDTLALCVQELPREKGALSAVFSVGSENIPLHKNAVISIKHDEALKPELQKKLLLACIDTKGRARSAGGSYENGYVSARTTSPGKFIVMYDTISPVIAIVNADKNNRVKDSTSLRIKITDNFSGISSYKVKLNDRFILAEYDAKSDMLDYFFDENTPFNIPSKLEVVICDRKDNCTVLSREIVIIK